VSTPPEDPYAHLFRDPEPAREPSTPTYGEPEMEIRESVNVEMIPADEPDVLEEDDRESEGLEVELFDEVVPDDEVMIAESDAEVVGDAPLAPAPPNVSPESPRTGRLFRSVGADAATDALPAVAPHQASKLRTLKQGEPAPAAPLVIGGFRDEPPVREESPRTVERQEREYRNEEPRLARTGSLTAIGAYVIVTAVTVILALGSALIFGQAMGLLTGLGLIATSVFSAIAIRRSDDINAVFAPPIAYFLTIITAGQIGLNVSSFSGRLVEIFFLMGTNWIWLAIAVLAALIIVALRRRTSNA